jgi:hypothetical protein
MEDSMGAASAQRLVIEPLLNPLLVGPGTQLGMGWLAD